MLHVYTRQLAIAYFCMLWYMFFKLIIRSQSRAVALAATAAAAVVSSARPRYKLLTDNEKHFLGCLLAIAF
jgi:hypothetical protein